MKENKTWKPIAVVLGVLLFVSVIMSISPELRNTMPTGIYGAEQCVCPIPNYNDCFSVWEVEIRGELIPILHKQPMSDTLIELEDGFKTSTCEILKERCLSKYYSTTCEWEPITNTCRCYVTSRELVNKTGILYMSTELGG